jgi:hypothetical protein
MAIARIERPDVLKRQLDVVAARAEIRAFAAAVQLSWLVQVWEGATRAAMSGHRVCGTMRVV